MKKPTSPLSFTPQFAAKELIAAQIFTFYRDSKTIAENAIIAQRQN